MDMLKNVLFFNSMITPKVLVFIYWLALVLCILGGLASIFSGNVLPGVIALVVGPVCYRILFEAIIIAFKNNEYLKKIAEKE
jgi:hypothetical protein